MNHPDVSVVIPIFSRTKELGESIESVLSQSFQEFEIVLVDNNAKKETREIGLRYAALYPEKIRIVSETVQGVCSARNKGIMESRGTYIATQDEDDLMKHHRLESQRDLLLKRPEVSLVTCYYDILSPDGSSVLKSKVKSPTINTERSFGAIEKEIVLLFKSYLDPVWADSFHFHVPSGFMFRKETAIKAGLFDVRFNPQFLEDYEFAVRMFAQGPFAQVPESLFYFRESPWKVNKDSFSETPIKYQVHSNWHQNDQFFFDSLVDRFSKISSKNLGILEKIRAILIRTVGLHALRYPDGAELGSILLKRAWFARPSDVFTLKLYLKTFFPRVLFPKLFWFDMFEFGTLEKVKKDFLHNFLKERHSYHRNFSKY